MKKIAIIGASYLQLPLVLKAKEMGLEVHCFAWEEGAVCKQYADFFYPISIIEKESILKECKKIKIDGVCSIASDVAVTTVSYIAENMGLIGNSIESAETSTNKYLMRKMLQKNSVNIPLYACDNEVDVIRKMSIPVIVKPTDRSGSLGVQKINCTEKLQPAIDFAKSQSLSNTAIIEEFIEGVEVSVEAISWQGKHFVLTITDKDTTGEPYFVELGHHQPTKLPKEIQEKIINQTILSLTALNIKFGASHSEFKITESGDVFAIEIGARMGGDFIGSDLVYLSTGFDFLKAIIDISLGKFYEPKLQQQTNSGVYFLSEETECLLKYFEEDFNAEWIIKKEQTKDELQSIRSSSERSGYIIYQWKEKIELIK